MPQILLAYAPTISVASVSFSNRRAHKIRLTNLLLVDPVVLSRLPALDLLLVEPEGDLLLRRLHSIGAVADVTADVDGEVAADGARRGGEWVGGSEQRTSRLHDILALPDHCTDWTAGHV